MFSESPALIRRLLRLLALPYCYLSLVNWKQCTSSKIQVAKDFLYIFFKLKYFPDNYSPCRLWEKDKKSWVYYYGSSYDPYQRRKLRKEVQKYEYLILFDDKEICDLLCRGIKDIQMPYLFGVATPSSNYIEQIENIFDTHALEKLMVKPTRGSAGQGIALVVKDKDGLYVHSNGAVKNIEKYQLKEHSILQEVVVQEEDIAKIAPNSVNTIRVVTLYTKSGESIIVSASMRFGVGGALVDNWSAGGVAVGVDHVAGKLKKIAFDKHGNEYLKHPITGVSFEGYQLPMWNSIIDMAKSIQKTFSFFKLLGLDIAVTNNGPVLIEVNPSTDLVFQEQTAGPLLKDKNVLEEFDRYDLLINKYQKELLDRYD